MFSIANSDTRKSLKTVFEHIFAKYGREFAEDDEVDLISLEVTKPGGHLARIKPLQFGDAFKRKPAFIVDSVTLAEGPITARDEDIFEMNRRGLPSEDEEQATIATASQLHSNLVNAIAQTSSRKKFKGVPNRSRKPRKRKGKDFNSFLANILHEEATTMSVGLKAPHPTGCFDCLLFGIILREKAAI